MMIKKIKLLLFFVIVSFALQAQKPMLYPLRSNATLIEYYKNKAKQSHVIQANNRTQSVATQTLTLPFYDEFSYAGPFPDTTKWPNSQSVFVNHTKAIAPPTLGVATFDGLNKFGYPYNSTIASNNLNTLTSVASDTLNSAPIRLDSLPAAQLPLSPGDSVYLSFYYQAMGYWEKPEPTDYFNLDFYSPKDTTWTQVWSLGGYTYAPDSSWHLVMIPVLDTSYFHNGFKFRFRNLSGACGDIDHWHIDAVYLNHCRTNTDTMFSSTSSPCYNPFGDVSFVYDLQSPLKNYSQMPFNQYAGAADMKDSIGVALRSNFTSTVSATSHTTFYSSTGQTIATYTNGADNLFPYNNSGYCNKRAIMHPSLNGFTYPTSTDSSFTMKFFIENTTDNIHSNDTITFHQKFSNYYAYDDGSAEAGFGIDPGGAGNYQMAAKFTTNVGDTLHAMDIFFEPIIDVDLIKNEPFNIMVWADNGGKPGNIIYTDTMRSPYFTADSLVNGLITRENVFLRYQFRHGQFIPGGTTFYLGINQIYDSPEITVGFDRNYDFHNNFFYNTNYNNTVSWYPLPGDLDADYRGSLMIHAVFGDSLQTLAINKIKNNSTNISLYPNPAADYVVIQSDDLISKVVITDLLGNIVLQQTEESVKKINTLSLPSGVYLVKALTNKGFTDTQKLIIAK